MNGRIRRMAVGIALALFLVASPAAAELFLVTAPYAVLVTTPGTTLAVCIVKQNTIAALESVLDDWAQVRLDGGRSGWLPLSSGRRIGSEEPPLSPAAVAPESGKPATVTVPQPEPVVKPEIRPGPVTVSPPRSLPSSAAPARATPPTQRPRRADTVTVPLAPGVLPPEANARLRMVSSCTITASTSMPKFAPAQVSSPLVPLPRVVKFYLRTDATIRTSENEVLMIAGTTLAMVPGDTRTRLAEARGEVRVLCRALNGTLRALEPGAYWLPHDPGRYAVVLTGEQLRAGATIRVTVTADTARLTSSGVGLVVPSTLYVTPGAALLYGEPALPAQPAQWPLAAGSALHWTAVPSAVTASVQPATVDGSDGFDGSALYRGLRFAPGMPLAQLVAAWGPPDEQYGKNDGRYYRFGPVTVMTENANPERISGVIFGAGWSVLGVQPGMTMAEVQARWGQPAMPPMPTASGVWRCGYFRNGFVLGCSLAGPAGPVTDISVAPR